MNAVEEIEAAIGKLTKLKVESSSGPWAARRYDYDGPDKPERVRVTSPADDDAYNTAEGVLPVDAALIATLHATIDAQLATLRAASNDEWEAKEHWAEVGKPHLRGPAKIVPINMAALALARAINGATS